MTKEAGTAKAKGQNGDRKGTRAPTDWKNAQNGASKVKFSVGAIQANFLRLMGIFPWRTGSRSRWAGFRRTERGPRPSPPQDTRPHFPLRNFRKDKPRPTTLGALSNFMFQRSDHPRATVSISIFLAGLLRRPPLRRSRLTSPERECRERFYPVAPGIPFAPSRASHTNHSQHTNQASAGSTALLSNFPQNNKNAGHSNCKKCSEIHDNDAPHNTPTTNQTRRVRYEY